jgi:hypothetical protein
LGVEFLHQGRADASSAAAGDEGATRHCEIIDEKKERKRKKKGE